MTQPPKRKKLRLPDYDYGQTGYYFVTLCTAQRNENILCTLVPNVAAIINRPQVQVELTPWGQVTQEAIRAIPEHYPSVTVDSFVIMPDHVHIIINIQGMDANGRQIAAPTSLSRIMQQLKRAISRRLGASIWQQSFHDHIIRNSRDLEETRSYIQTNPVRACLSALNTSIS